MFTSLSQKKDKLLLKHIRHRRTSMKLLKKGIVLLMVGLLGFGVVGCSKVADNSQTNNKTEDVVIATVGDGKVTKKALDQQLVYLDSLMQWQYGEDYESNEEAMNYYNEQKRLMVDYLVEIQLIISKAQEYDVNVTADDVDEELELLKSDYDTEAAFEEALTTSGMSLEELKQMLKEDLIVNQVVTASTKDITVSDEEIKTYYDGNIDSFKTEAGATMSHILVATEEEAKEIKAKYDKGTSFEDLAEEYGTDATKSQGGLLEYIPYNSTKYDADFLASAKQLDEGEVSEPVKTQKGWHLIKVTDVNKEERIKSYDEVKDEIKEQLLIQKQNEVVEKKVKEWKESTNIVINEDLI